MNKLGAQCQMRSGDLLDYCRVVRPRAAMGIMVQERNFYRELADLHVESIYRHWPNFWWDTAPEQRAWEAVSALRQETADFRDLLTWVCGNNEYIYSFDHARHDIADRFAAALIHEVHEQLGIHAIVLNLNTGHFRDDVLVFGRTLAALNECGECRLGWHEYGWPTMYQQYCDGLQEGNDGMWHALRWKVASRTIHEAGYHNVKFAITECGIDGGVSGLDNLGWRKVHDDWGMALANYRRSLAWYMDALERDPDVDFALVFGCGLNDDWRGKGFELPRDLWEWIRDYKIYPEVKL